jgi:hypothetical protein
MTQKFKNSLSGPGLKIVIETNKILVKVSGGSEEFDTVMTNGGKVGDLQLNEKQIDWLERNQHFVDLQVDYENFYGN